MEASGDLSIMEMNDNLPLLGIRPGIKLVSSSRPVICCNTQALRVRGKHCQEAGTTRVQLRISRARKSSGKTCTNNVTIPVVSRITGGHTKMSEATAVEAAEATTLTATTDAGAEVSATAVDKIRSVEAGAEALTETALLVEGEVVHLTPRTETPSRTMAEVTDPLTGTGTSRTSQ